MIFLDSEIKFRAQQRAKIDWTIASKIAWLKNLFYANKIAPKTAQEVLKELQDASKIPLTFQDGKRRPQDASEKVQDASKPAPEPSRPRFWTMFDRFLVHFGLIVGWFLVHLSSIFHSISRFKKQAFQHQKTKIKARWRVRSSAARWIQIHRNINR